METVDDIVSFVNQQSADAPVMQQLQVALGYIALQEAQAEIALRRYVKAVRKSGVSWKEIGSVLGVGEHAARERFDPESTADVPRPLTLYSEDARKAVGAAGAKARELGSPHIGTEHLLLGLLDNPDSRASKAIAAITLPGRSIMKTIMDGIVIREATPTANLPFTPRAQRVMQKLAPREMLSAGVERIDSEHLLMAMFADEGGTACRVLNAVAITRERARGWLDHAP